MVSALKEAAELDEIDTTPTFMSVLYTESSYINLEP